MRQHQWSLVVLFLAATARADDWPQFLGPQRNGQSAEKGLVWPAKITPAWTRKVGEGYSAPAIAGDRLIVFHRLGDDPAKDARVFGEGRRPEEMLDVSLVGRRVTVVLNGKRIICDAEIPGPTGGALDSKEGAPGPIMLQGDHGPVEYRNLVITPAR